MRYLLLALALVWAPLAHAGDYIVRDGNGNLLTLRGQSATGGQTVPQHVPSDPTGTPYSASNPYPVGVISALPGGSNVIGGVTQSGTWNIGSISSLPALPTGANVIGGVTQSGSWTVNQGGAPWSASLTQGGSALSASNPLPAQLSINGGTPPVPTSDAAAVTNALFVGRWLYNGSTIDRQRAAVGTTGVAAVNSEGTKATYGYSPVNQTPAATPTDVLVIQGSATKTIRIKRIAISGQATTAGLIYFSLIRRSAADSGGTSSAGAAQKFDTNDPAASAAVTLYTANPTSVGTAVGTILSSRIALTTTGTTVDKFVMDFSTRNDESIVLRGTSDFLAINLSGQTMPSGAVLDYSITWTEE